MVLSISISPETEARLKAQAKAAGVDVATFAAQQLDQVTSLPLTEDAAGAQWASGIGREWADDLADSRQDIYDLSDGEPVNEIR